MPATIDPGINFNPTSPTLGVSAGIGPFNASLAEEWKSWVLSTYLVTEFPTFLADSTVSYPTNYAASHSPCANNTQTCHSNYFPGVLGIVSPSVVEVKFNESLNGDTFIVNHVQGVHVDYWEVDKLEGNWTSDDCQMWGSNKSALRVCLSTSKVTKNALVAGTFRTLFKVNFRFGNVQLSKSGVQKRMSERFILVIIFQ